MKSITCSLLIPQSLRILFFHRINQHGDLRNFFHCLVISLNQPVSGEFQKVTANYQECYLNLSKYNFRCSPEDWLKFGMIAQARGISRTLLFVLLLKEMTGVPAKRIAFAFIIKIDPDNPETFFRKFYSNSG